LTRLAGASPTVDSLPALRKIVAARKQQYERIDRLFSKGVTAAPEHERAKLEYELSVDRLRQAEHQLELRESLLALAELDLKTAVEANRKNPGAVPAVELKRKKILVEIAKAKVRELAD
ncbi:MAG: hypothetical protein AAF961_07910, partial [Planctomycetota bacterium]